MNKCKHPKNRIVPFGEFNERDGCLDCGRTIILKSPPPKKVIRGVWMPRAEYQKLIKNSNTLALIIKHEMALCEWKCDGKSRWSAVAKYNGEGDNIYSAVRRAVKLEK